MTGKCRLCLRLSNNFQNIFTYQDDNLPSLTGCISTFFGVQIKPDDNFPTTICKECLEVIHCVNIYKNQFQSNQETLRDEMVTQLYDIVCEKINENQNCAIETSTVQDLLMKTNQPTANSTEPNLQPVLKPVRVQNHTVINSNLKPSSLKTYIRSSRTPNLLKRKHVASKTDNNNTPASDKSVLDANVSSAIKTEESVVEEPQASAPKPPCEVEETVNVKTESDTDTATTNLQPSTKIKDHTYCVPTYMRSYVNRNKKNNCVLQQTENNRLFLCPLCAGTFDSTEAVTSHQQLCELRIT